MYTAWRGLASEMTISWLPTWFSTTHLRPCSHSVRAGLLAAGCALGAAAEVAAPLASAAPFYACSQLHVLEKLSSI